MLKKLVLGTLVFTCGVTGVSFANDYVTKAEFNQVANDVYDLNNDSIIRDWRLEDKIKDTNKRIDGLTAYDDTKINQDIANTNKRIDDLQFPTYDDSNIVKQIDTIKESNDKLQGQVQNNTTLLNSVQEQLQDLTGEFANFKQETRKGIASAIAIASLEKPVFDSEHKTSIMIGTGTYKGTTQVAYGIAYQPNYDMVFSIKGTNEAVGCSMGFNL